MDAHEEYKKIEKWIMDKTLEGELFRQYSMTNLLEDTCPICKKMKKGVM